MRFNIYIKKQKIDPAYTDIINEYKKRLSPYCTVKLISVKNESQIKSINCRNACTVLVGADGNRISSPEFAERISEYNINSISVFNVFVDMEFTGDGFSLCLLSLAPSAGGTLAALYEQIYRAFKILRGEPYHK